MGNVLGNLVALVVIIICVVVSVISFGAGAVTVAVVAYGSFLFLWLGDVLNRPARSAQFMMMMSDAEFGAFRKYHLHLRFPGAGQAMSAFLNALRLAGIVWGALSLWWGEYWLGALLLGYFFVVGFACLRFDPATYMLRQANAGHEVARRQLMLIEQARDTLELLSEVAAQERRAKDGE